MDGTNLTRTFAPFLLSRNSSIAEFTTNVSDSGGECFSAIVFSLSYAEGVSETLNLLLFLRMCHQMASNETKGHQMSPSGQALLWYKIDPRCLAGAAEICGGGRCSCVWVSHTGQSPSKEGGMASKPDLDAERSLESMLFRVVPSFC